MTVTQLSVVKALPYIVSNVRAIFKVLPLAVAVICFANVVKLLINHRFLLGAGMIPYEIYLAHVFTLGLVKNSLPRIGVFIAALIALAACLHFITMKPGRT